MSEYFDSKQNIINSQLNRSRKLASTHCNNQLPPQQYQVLIEFELKRQKQKTRILQQRLRNKQVFIQQMKQFQDQLTLAFQKCQQQLIFTKKQLQYVQNNQLRENAEQIADLKHLVIRLQDQIIYKESHKVPTAKNKFQFKKASKKQFISAKKCRAKTVMHDQEIEFNNNRNVSGLTQQIISNSNKIGDFFKQFLSMVGIYCQDLDQQKFMTKLKIGWKWIKRVVKQWHYGCFQKNKVKLSTDEIIESIRALLLKVDKKDDSQVKDQIINLIKQLNSQLS